MEIIRIEHVVESHCLRAKRVRHIEDGRVEWLEPSLGAQGMPDWIRLKAEDAERLEHAFEAVLLDFEAEEEGRDLAEAKAQKIRDSY